MITNEPAKLRPISSTTEIKDFLLTDTYGVSHLAVTLCIAYIEVAEFSAPYGLKTQTSIVKMKGEAT